MPDPKLVYLRSLPRPPQCTSINSLVRSLLDGIWGVLKGSWGVLVAIVGFGTQSANSDHEL